MNSSLRYESLGKKDISGRFSNGDFVLVFTYDDMWDKGKWEINWYVV